MKDTKDALGFGVNADMKVEQIAMILGIIIATKEAIDTAVYGDNISNISGFFREEISMKCHYLER